MREAAQLRVVAVVPAGILLFLLLLINKYAGRTVRAPVLPQFGPFIKTDTERKFAVATEVGRAEGRRK